VALSVDAPVPGRVAALADELSRDLAGFDRRRERHGLVLKRLGDRRPATVRGPLRRALAGTAPFALRVAEVGVFRDPPAGPAPVVYLAVESPGLRATHDRLVEAFGAVEGLEGEAYVPHVTLARGGDPAAADRLEGRTVGPVEWTAQRLVLFDATHRERAGELRLPV
jgi:2'-5' RNA ligase